MQTTTEFINKLNELVMGLVRFSDRTADRIEMLEAVEDELRLDGLENEIRAHADIIETAVDLAVRFVEEHPF